MRRLKVETMNLLNFVRPQAAAPANRGQSAPHASAPGGVCVPTSPARAFPVAACLMPTLLMTAWLMVTCLIAASGPAQAAERVPVDRIYISVNAKAITLREVAEVRELRESQLRQEYKGAELEARMGALEAELTGTLIDELLLQSHAERLQLQVSDKELEERVDALVRRQPELAQQYPEDQIKIFVLKDILTRRVIEREVDARVTVSQAEIQAACRLRVQENKEVEVGHILLRGESEAVLSQLRGLRARIEAGEDFEQLAAEYSQDPSVSQNKGRLGFIRRGQFVKPFEDAAFRLEVGQLSAPVETRFGHHLIKVFASRTPEKMDCAKLDDVASQGLQNQIYGTKREAGLQALLQDLRRQSDIRIYK